MIFDPLKIFPNSNPENLFESSKPSKDYNCVAWAVEDDSKWYWPDPENFAYWPPDLQREETLESFVSLFESLGYQICYSHAPEDSFVRIAIFVNDRNEPTHVSRQLRNKWWTSKIGDWEDITHTLEAIQSNYYGKIAVMMKRPNPEAN